MRFCALICCILVALTANSQTKEAQFKKIEDLLKKSNGFGTDALKIGDQVFNEKTIKASASAEGANEVNVYSKMDWDRFEYYVEELDNLETISSVTIRFHKDIQVTTYENNKKLHEDTDDELILLISTADAKLIKQQLGVLKTYTWKSLNEVRTLDREELISFLTKKLNAAVEEEEGKVKSITDCEITFAYPDEEIIILTKKISLHRDKDYEASHQFCYGEQTGLVKIKKNSTWESHNMEHPEIDLDLGKDEDTSIQVEYAIRRLSTYCK